MGKVSRRVYKRNKKRYTKKRYTRKRYTKKRYTKKRYTRKRYTKKRYQKKNRRTLKRKKYTKQKGGICLRGLCKEYVTMDVLLLDSNSKEDKDEVGSLFKQIKKNNKYKEKLIKSFEPPPTEKLWNMPQLGTEIYPKYDSRYAIDSIKKGIYEGLNVKYSLKKHLLLNVFKYYNINDYYNLPWLATSTAEGDPDRDSRRNFSWLNTIEMSIEEHYITENNFIENIPGNIQIELKNKLKIELKEELKNVLKKFWRRLKGFAAHSNQCYYFLNTIEYLNNSIHFGRVRIIHNYLLKMSEQELTDIFNSLKGNIKETIDEQKTKTFSRNYYRLLDNAYTELENNTNLKELENNTNLTWDNNLTWDKTTFDKHLFLLQHSRSYTGGPGEYSIIGNNLLKDQTPPIRRRNLGMRNLLYVIPKSNLYVDNYNSIYRRYARKRNTIYGANSLDGIKIRDTMLETDATDYDFYGHINKDNSLIIHNIDAYYNAYFTLSYDIYEPVLATNHLLLDTE